MQKEINKMYKSKNYISPLNGKIAKNLINDFNLYARYYKKNYSKFLPKNKSVKILDLGCGNGRFLYFLKKKGYKNFIGVDMQKKNIDFCIKQKLPIKKSDIFVFLKENKKHFDVIVMNDLIEHFEKNQVLKLLKLAYKNLSKNGILIVKTPNMSNPILASSSKYINFTHEIGLTEESLKQILKFSGFKKCRIYSPDPYIFYQSPLNFLAKISVSIINSIFRLIFLLYGRKTTKIYTKNLIAVATKKQWRQFYTILL